MGNHTGWIVMSYEKGTFIVPWGVSSVIVIQSVTRNPEFSTAGKPELPSGTCLSCDVSLSLPLFVRRFVTSRRNTCPSCSFCLVATTFYDTTQVQVFIASVLTLRLGMRDHARVLL
jgi:hypothetical protein